MKINKSRIRKKLLKVNFTTIFFFVLSLISITFAWFAYSNIVNNDLKVDIKAWNIDISDENNELSNEIGIEISNFYPGSQEYSKTIQINNTGDLDAKINYRITYLRIFDTEYNIDNQENILDLLSQNSPFTINFSINDNYLKSNQNTSFIYSVSWPLDSGNDVLDSQWGALAYNFLNAEKAKKELDNSYEIRNSIDIEVELVVNQCLEEEKDDYKDINYLVGSEYLFDNSNNSCNTVSSNCFKYYILNDTKNSDNTVKYMMDPTQNISLVNANQITNTININDILNVIKTDVLDTKIVINNLSKRVLGNTNESNYSTIINNIKNNNGSIEFSKNNFYFLSSNTCYWINEPYNSTKTFAIKNKDENTIMLYGEDNTNNCKLVNVITKQKQ